MFMISIRQARVVNACHIVLSISFLFLILIMRLTKLMCACAKYINIRKRLVLLSFNIAKNTNQQGLCTYITLPATRKINKC